MRRIIGLVVALATLIGPAPVLAAPISALMGLDPDAVRHRLAQVPPGWPVPAGFQVATDKGVTQFLTVHELLTDPVLAERMAIFRTQGDRLPTDPYLECRARLTRADGASEDVYSTLLVFRAGRLDGVFEHVPEPVEAAPPANDRKAWEAWLRRPRISPFQAQFGQLPLEDGAGFLSRWGMRPLAANDDLAATCAPPPPPRVPPPHRHSGLDASDMQGLALLPFAVSLPGKNAQRVAARRDGAALLATLRVGEPLGETPQAFAAHHKGVRAYAGHAADYAVLSLDLGGYPGRNLTNFNDVALIGVRAGRIAWLSTPVSIGPDPSVLCLDAQGVPNAPRRGCSGWGQFSP